jgi:hypothetical protein
MYIYIFFLIFVKYVFQLTTCLLNVLETRKVELLVVTRSDSCENWAFLLEFSLFAHLRKFPLRRRQLIHSYYPYSEEVGSCEVWWTYRPGHIAKPTYHLLAETNCEEPLSLCGSKHRVAETVGSIFWEVLCSQQEECSSHVSLEMRPSLWSSGRSSWLQIQRSQVRFLALLDFLRSSGSGMESTQTRGDIWWVTWKKKIATPVYKTEINGCGKPPRWSLNRHNSLAD